MQYVPVDNEHHDTITAQQPAIPVATTAALPTYADIGGTINNKSDASSHVDNSLNGKITTASSTSSVMNNSNNNNNGNVSASSMLGLDSAELSSVVTKLRNRRWAATMRPLPVFAAQTQFSRPRTTAEAMARAEANLPYFLTNYLGLCAIVVIITVLTQPSLILVGLVVGALWFGATRVEELRLPGQIVLAGRNKMIALLSTTGLLIFLFAGSIIFMLLGLCATLVLGHAVLHIMPPLDDAGEGNEMDSFIGSDGEFDPSPA